MPPVYQGTKVGLILTVQLGSTLCMSYSNLCTTVRQKAGKKPNGLTLVFWVQLYIAIGKLLKWNKLV